MGCDIHLYTEQLTTVDGQKVWRNVDLYEFDYYDNKYDVESVYENRSYDCFASLANVRNYDHIEPLSDPRGLPSDIHERTKIHADKWDGDGHSHSHCTLQELYEYQAKFPSRKQSGMVSVEQAEIIDAEGAPDEWCQMTNAQGYVLREWIRDGSPVDALVRAVEVRAKKLNYMQYCEGRVPKDRAREFRIVFFFDN